MKHLLKHLLSHVLPALFALPLVPCPSAVDAGNIWPLGNSITYGQDKPNGLHPSAEGYVKMGNIWANAIAANPTDFAPDPFPGNPPITPAWALKHWVWEDVSNTQSSTENLVAGYLSRNIPVGAVIIDSPWSTAYNNFEWNTARYPDAPGMITSFHAQGVRVVLWATGFLNNQAGDGAIIADPDYNYAKQQGYVVTNPSNGSVDFTWWKGTGEHLDFTNPSAKTWWHTRLDEVLGLGIDGWKVDEGPDRLSANIQTCLGTMSRAVFRKYYYADLYDYARSVNPQAVIIARGYSPRGSDTSDTNTEASISKVPLVWNGDYSGDFAGLIQQMNDVYDSANRGYGAPGVEVGGYSAPNATKISLIRYAQFGAMTALMENGGANGGLTEHLPWYWDSQTTDIYRYFAVLHNELAPYNFSYIVDAHLNGGSLLQEADGVAGHHKLGDQIFVSVITNAATSKSIAFPYGANWIDYWNEAALYEGGSTTNYSAPLNQYPIFLKAGAIIPLDVNSAVCNHGDTNSNGKITVLVYPAGMSAFNFHHPTGDGTNYEDIAFSMNEDAGTLTVTGAVPRDYIFRVKSFTPPTAVSGASSWSYDAALKYLIIQKNGATFTIAISGLAGYGSQVINLPTQPLVGNLSPASYRLALLTSNAPVYVDRSFVYTNIPPELLGQKCIQSANNDKQSSSTSPWITFDLGQLADVYVLYTDLNTDLSSQWLTSANGWEGIGFTVGTTISGSGEATRLIKERRYHAGPVVLNGNGGLNDTCSMYTVVVISAGSNPTQHPCLQITASALTPQPVLLFYAKAGGNYVIESASILQGPWTLLKSFTGIGCNVTYTDSQPLAAARFYRVTED